MNPPTSLLPSRTRQAMLLACATFLIGCGGDLGGGVVCGSRAECGADERCLGGRCVPIEPSSDGGGDAGRTDTGSPPMDTGLSDAACIAIEGGAERVERPVDIILMVDATPSMGPAVARIEEVINRDFARVIGDSGVDYRVILLARDVTIGPPLSGSGRLNQLDVLLGSGSPLAFKPVLDRYAEWSRWLRLEAIKVFLHFTDSNDGDGGRNISGYAGSFDEELIRIDPAHFGTAGDRNFVYHAIVGVRENTPPTAPYLPTNGCMGGDPVVAAACSTPDFGDPPGPGPGFQELAIRTGGLRFPVCQFASFDVVFRQIAADVIDVSSVPCTFRFPAAPPGETVDPETVVLRFSATGGDPWQTFRRVGSTAECTAESFLMTSEGIDLCPNACAAVQCSPDAQLRVVAGCHPFLM